jgi:hypothetical protein
LLPASGRTKTANGSDQSSGIVPHNATVGDSLAVIAPVEVGSHLLKP